MVSVAGSLTERVLASLVAAIQQQGLKMQEKFNKKV
jgi:hypothetical protein